MAHPSRLVSAPPDPRGRLVSIFVGAVLLPSLALSVVLFYLIPRHAEATKLTLLKRAEKILFYVEQDLEETARKKALEAAEVVGPDRLLEGRPTVIRAALRKAGFEAGMFDRIHLEVSARRSPRGAAGERRDEEAFREALAGVEPFEGLDGDDSVGFSLGAGKAMGTLRFRYSCGYAHGTLLREYFEKDFTNPEQSLVIRVTEPTGQILYETAPTENGRSFEVKRMMTAPSFRGLKLYLRYRERSIAEDVRRWKMGTMTLIGFIDLMLGAGLFLVYSNVRREMHLSRLKSDFVANVSHELKTPLALIRLFAETLELGRVPSDEKARQYYRVINKESQRLTQLINNILDFSRIEAGRKEYDFVRTDLTRVIEEVVEAYRFQVEQQGFVLEMEIADEIPELEIDKEALSQALLNLVHNAVKYSREEKRIRVSARQDGDRVLISVSDRGIGIAKNEQRKIFDKFYRAEDSLVHETKGSGLGLALVRHIVEAHGGEVLLESNPGRGSTFTLVLPLIKEKGK